VIDDDGAFLGVVSAGDVEQAIASSRGDQNARALIHETPDLYMDQTLDEAIWRLNTTDDDGLPVLDRDGTHAIAWLTHRGLLTAYRERLGGADPASRS